VNYGTLLAYVTANVQTRSHPPRTPAASVSETDCIPAAQYGYLQTALFCLCTLCTLNTSYHVG